MDKEVEELWFHLQGMQERFFNQEDQFRKKRLERESMSMVHWQRDALIVIYITTDKEKRPYKFSAILLNSNIEICRYFYPFEAYLFLEEGEIVPKEEREAYKMGMVHKTFLRLFDLWYKKANLGVTPVGEPIKLLPLLANEEQLFLLRELFTPEVFTDYFEKPYRLLTTIAAYENDVAAMRGKIATYGKHTYTQLAAKLGMPIARTASALERCLRMANVYRKLTQTSVSIL